MITQLVPFKIPLREYSEAFPEYAAHTSTHRRSGAPDEGEPATHVVIAALLIGIYELNKCATSPTPTNCKGRSKQVAVCHSYAKAYDVFLILLNGRPLKAVGAEIARISEGGNANEKHPTHVRHESRMSVEWTRWGIFGPLLLRYSRARNVNSHAHRCR